MEVWNTQVKVFPDGTTRLLYSSNSYELCSTAKPCIHDGHSIHRKEVDNMKRAVQKVFDYARSNDFDWFITLTFDDEKVVDRYDYDSITEALKVWTKGLCQKHGFSWLIVPETHEKGGYHFHGLIKGDLPVTEARNHYTKELLFDPSGNQIYNVVGYNFGFTTATKIKDRQRTASYIAKYLTKEIVVPKGRKRYWASRSLQLPTTEKVYFTEEEFYSIYTDANYTKVMENDYGKFILAEYKGKDN